MENRNNNPIAEEIIHNNPTGYGLFAGIGDNFNSAAQAICELADDAISNLRANSDDPDLSMTIVVSFENLGDAVEIGVVDGGTGITNLDSALTIACRDGAQTPLNEHGFGLKHALASCDSSPSQQWSIRTRTKKDAAANQYREVTAPYSMGTSEEDQPMKVFFYPGAGGLPYRTVPIPSELAQYLKEKENTANSEYVVCNRNGGLLSGSQYSRLWKYVTTRSTKPREYTRIAPDGTKTKHRVVPTLGERAAHNSHVIYSIDFRVTPHMLRHTYITNLIYAGVDPKTVQYLAGHENSKITMDIYAEAKYNKPDALAARVNYAFNIPNL